MIIKNITLMKMEYKFQFFSKTGQIGVPMKFFGTPEQQVEKRSTVPVKTGRLVTLAQINENAFTARTT